MLAKQCMDHGRFSCLKPAEPSCSPGKITCFDSEEAYTTFWNNTLVSPPLDVRGNFTEQTDIDYFYSQVPVLDALWPAFGQICLEGESGQYLPYVGTAATARDMVALASYLDGDDAPVNYWGKSWCIHLPPFLTIEGLRVELWYNHRKLFHQHVP